ncbi:carbohydrate-binding module family 50 protein [Xylariomycetidae sp. FL0641]|nr:carbohydrate-binding module family 50 protein [Xylariomycetidae sp. FL0641]
MFSDMIVSVAALAAFAGQALANPAPVPVGKLMARQGYTEDCKATYSVESGDTCLKIQHSFDDVWPLENFYEWNPQVDMNCTNLYPGEVVCVGDGAYYPKPACPAPVDQGVVANCASCYVVQDGDSCPSITEANDVSMQQLLLWNPSLNAACTNLALGYNYCVAVEA